MISRRFPRSAFFYRASQAIFLASSLGLAISPVANGKDDPKPNDRTAQPRPVARLIATSTQGVSPRERPRLVRTSSPSNSARVSPSSYSASTAAVSVAATSDERRAFELVNAERQRRGLRPLILDGALTRIARYHSETMAREGVLSHVERSGLDLSGRAAEFGLHGWRTLGENIAYNQGFDDPTAFAVERWMISTQHRANILNGQFTHAGIGIARAADGRIFFTQVFMER